MEESIGKKRIRISTLFSLFIAIFTIYCLIYLFLRINHDIVHVVAEKNGAQHTIMADMPMGHELFMTTLINEKNSENIDQKLQKKIDFHQRKKKYLDISFYPIIEVEKMCWALFYQKKT